MIHVVSAADKIYQNDIVSGDAPLTPTQTTISAAQNEFEGFQLVVTGPASNVSVTINAPLTGRAPARRRHPPASGRSTSDNERRASSNPRGIRAARAGREPRRPT